VGWEVVAALDEELRASAPALGSVRTCACDRPGAGLVALLRGAARVVVVDAARLPDCAPGALRWLRVSEAAALAPASSHGFGVAQALGLAQALGELPKEVRLLAIAAQRFEGDELSEPVRSALPLAVRSIRALLFAFDRDPMSAYDDGNLSRPLRSVD
jgi:hydrogenase maturation protease